jgi:hypothetical protein
VIARGGLSGAAPGSETPISRAICSRIFRAPDGTPPRTDRAGRRRRAASTGRYRSVQIQWFRGRLPTWPRGDA